MIADAAPAPRAHDAAHAPPGQQHPAQDRQRVLVLAAHPGRVQEIVDLRPMKGTNGGLSREAPEAVAAMARLRQVLASQVP